MNEQKAEGENWIKVARSPRSYERWHKMHKPFLHGMFWVLSLSLALAGCGSGTRLKPMGVKIYPSQVPGIVQRADSISREEAIEILRGILQAPYGPRHMMVESNGLRWPGGKRVRQSGVVGSDRDVYFEQVEETGPAAFWPFANVYGCTISEYPKRSLVWICLKPDYRILIVVAGDKEGEEFKDLLAALYKLCPDFR